MSITSDEWNDFNVSIYEPTIISLGKLPPQTDGPVSGYLRLTAELNLKFENFDEQKWLMRIRWWGSMNITEKGDILRERQELCFPVVVPKETFQLYDEEMLQLKVDVVHKDSHKVMYEALVPIFHAELDLPNGILKEVHVTKKDSSESAGKLKLKASLVWGYTESDSQPRHVGQEVRIWKNKDFSDKIKSQWNSPSSPSKDQLPQSKPSSSSVIERLLQKGERLQHSIEHALKNDESTRGDVQMVLASAKSFGPVEWNTNYHPTASRAIPSSPFVQDIKISPSPSVRSIPNISLVLLLSIKEMKIFQHVPLPSKGFVYITLKSPFSNTSYSTKWKNAGRGVIPIQYEEVFPFELNEASLELVEKRQMVFEIWTRGTSSPQLLGLVKVPLLSIAHYISENDEKSIKANQYPHFPLSDGNVHIKNPFQGSVDGFVVLRMGIGTDSQIQRYQKKQEAITRIQSIWRGYSARNTAGNATTCQAQDVQASSSPHTETKEIETSERSQHLLQYQVNPLDNNNSMQSHAAKIIQCAFRKWMYRAAQLDWSENDTIQSIDLAAIELLNGPIVYSATADKEQESNSSIHHHLMMDIVKPCPKSGGVSIRYRFEEEMSNLWWDSSSSVLSSKNEHIFMDTSGAVVSLVLLIYSPLDELVGHGTLFIDGYCAQIYHVPIIWAHQDYKEIISIPIRVQFSMLERTPCSAVRKDQLAPAQATIEMKLSSLQLDDVAGIGDVYFVCEMGIGDDVHEGIDAAEFNTDRRQSIAMKKSPKCPIHDHPIDTIINIPVVIHQRLIDSMQEDDVKIELWNHIMDMDIKLAETSLPLACLLFRRDGIKGIFPLLYDQSKVGRVSIEIRFIHNIDVNEMVGWDANRLIESVDAQMDPISIHDIPFLLKDIDESHKDDIPEEIPQVDTPDRKNLQVHIIEARNLENSNVLNAFTRFTWEGKEYVSHVVDASSNPLWNSFYQIPMNESSSLVVSLHTSPNEKCIGSIHVDLSLLKWTRVICGWYHLLDSGSNIMGQLKIEVKNEISNDSNDDDDTTSVDTKSASWSKLQELVEDLRVMDLTVERGLEPGATKLDSTDFSFQRQSVDESQGMDQAQGAGSDALDDSERSGQSGNDSNTSLPQEVEPHLDISPIHEANEYATHDDAMTIDDLTHDMPPSTWDIDELDMEALDIESSSEINEDVPTIASGEELDEESPNMQDTAHGDANSEASDDDIDMNALDIFTSEIKEYKKEGNDGESPSNDSETINIHGGNDMTLDLDDSVYSIRHSEDSIKIDLKDLEIFARNHSSSQSMDVHNESMEGSIQLKDHFQSDLLRQVLDTMEHIKTEISSLNKKNDDLAQQLADIPAIVAESCRESLISSHVTLMETNELQNSQRLSFQSSTAQLNENNSFLSTDELPEKKTSSTTAQTSPIQKKFVDMATSPCEISLQQDRDVHEAASDEICAVDDTALSKEQMPTQSNRYVHEAGNVPRVNFWDSLQASAFEPTPARLVATAKSSNNSFLYASDWKESHPPELSLSRPYRSLKSIDTTTLPKVFQLNNRPEQAETKGIPPAAFDSETERIARIMCGTLENWLQEDSSDEEFC